MAPLTLEVAVAAFQHAMPRRKGQFERVLLKFSPGNPNMSGSIYFERLLERLEEEMRERVDLAEKHMHDLLDSGWTPTLAEPLDATFEKMFQSNDNRYHPFDDIFDIAKKRSNYTGEPTPTGDAPVLKMRNIQAEAFDESLRRLEAHVVKEQPQAGDTFHGPTQYFRGDSNTGHFTSIVGNIDARSIHYAVTTVREHINEFAEDDRDDVQAHLATVEDELKKPEPNAGRLKASWRAVQKLVGAGASTALSAVIDSVVKNAMSG